MLKQCVVAVFLAAGLGGADVLHVPSVYPSIQEAIADAQSGDSVVVAAGFYNERIDFLGKAITVAGAGSGDSTLDGTGLDGPVVTFSSEEGAGSVLEGFRIGHGSGGLVEDQVFGAVLCGGGILIQSASPTIRDCDIENNECWGGGGVCVDGGMPTLTNCAFRENAVEGHGGGVYALHGARPTLTSCRFELNTASWGGGMTCTDGSDAELSACEFLANTTRNVGGGLYIRSSSDPTIDGCTFAWNVQVDNPLGSGGGICVYGSGTGGGPCYPSISNCLFEGNTVNGDGGGMSHAYGTFATVENCVFRGNASGRDGGGVACVGAHDPDVPSNSTFVDCVFENNTTAEEGGGFFSRASEPSISGCVLSGNQAAAGGGVYFFESPASLMEGTSVCGNTLPQVDGAHLDLGGNTVSDECPSCASDISGDGEVGVDDLLMLIEYFGPCDGCAADVDGDGIVGVDDILLVIAAWGPC